MPKKDGPKKTCHKEIITDLVEVIKFYGCSCIQSRISWSEILSWFLMRSLKCSLMKYIWLGMALSFKFSVVLKYSNFHNFTFFMRYLNFWIFVAWAIKILHQFSYPQNFSLCHHHILTHMNSLSSQIRFVRDAEKESCRRKRQSKPANESSVRIRRWRLRSHTRRHSDGNGQSKIHQRPKIWQPQVQRLLPRSLLHYQRTR